MGQILVFVTFVYCKGPTFFAQRKNFFVQLIFFPRKFFLVFWKREIFLSKKNLRGKKFTEQKSFFAEQKRLSLLQTFGLRR
jgi:hypothetical protein